MNRPAAKRLLAIALAIGGFGIAFVGSVTAAGGDTASLETLLLAACAAVATLMGVLAASNLSVSGSFCFALLAAVYVSPAAGFIVIAIAELATFAVIRLQGGRYRLVPLAMSIGSMGAPTVLTGVVYLAASTDGTAPDSATSLLLILLALAAIGWNNVVAIVGVALYDDLPLSVPLRSVATTIPGLAANAILFAGVGPVYGESRSAGLISAIALVLLVTYVSRLAVSARAREQRISDLATDRAELLREVVRIESLERRHLAEQVHDGPLQSALAARDDVRAALAGRPERLSAAAEALAGVASDLRSVASDLWGVEPRVHVAEAIAELAEQHARDGSRDVDVQLHYDTTEHDALVSAITRELLVNAIRHSEASTVTIRLTAEERRVLLEVSDDGQGIVQSDRDDARLRGHIGLASVEARAQAADGTFSIAANSEASGTIARVELPLSPVPPLPTPEPVVSDGRPRAVPRTVSDAAG